MTLTPEPMAGQTSRPSRVAPNTNPLETGVFAPRGPVADLPEVATVMSLMP